LRGQKKVAKEKAAPVSRACAFPVLLDEFGVCGTRSKNEKTHKGCELKQVLDQSSELACVTRRLVWCEWLFFEKLGRAGVEGLRRLSAALRTDFVRTLPSTPSTSMKNLAAGVRSPDRRFDRKLTSVCATPALFTLHGERTPCKHHWTSE